MAATPALNKEDNVARVNGGVLRAVSSCPGDKKPLELSVCPSDEPTATVLQRMAGWSASRKGQSDLFAVGLVWPPSATVFFDIMSVRDYVHKASVPEINCTLDFVNLEFLGLATVDIWGWIFLG